MPDPQQSQFDGQTPVSGYTLFHGKDGTNFYLKGENLADDDISQRVSKLRGQTAPAATQPAAAPTTQAPDSGFPLAEGLKAAAFGPLGMVAPYARNLLHSASEKAGNYVDAQDQSALSTANKTGQAPPGQAWGSYGPRMLKSALDYGASALEPKNMALTAGTIAAPEVFGPALIAHGGYNAIKNAPAALQGNPDAAEAALGGLSEAAGGAAATATPGQSAFGALRNKAAKSVAGPIVKKPLGATQEDIRFNRDPQAAIADEGLVGTKHGMVKQADARIGQLSDVTDQTLQNHPNANNQIDAEPIIDSAVDNAQKALRKVGNKSGLARLEDLRDALKTEYGPTKGTPFEVNNLKRAVGDAASDLGAFRSTDPVEASAASAMEDVYSGLKNAVNEQVPEVAPLNDRVSNLLSAKTGLKRNIALETNRPFLEGSLSHSAVKMIGNTVGSPFVRSIAARALNAGNVLDVPQVSPYSPALPRGFLGAGATPAGWSDASGPVSLPVPEGHTVVRTPNGDYVRALLPGPVHPQYEAPTGPAAAQAFSPNIGPPNAAGYAETTLAPDETRLGSLGRGGVRQPIRGLLPSPFSPNVSPSSAAGYAETPSPFSPRVPEPRPQYVYQPSEKAATMSAQRPDLGPEFNEGQVTHDIERSKAILRNPRATAEDRAVATDRLREAVRQRGYEH